MRYLELRKNNKPREEGDEIYEMKANPANTHPELRLRFALIEERMLLASAATSVRGTAESAGKVAQLRQFHAEQAAKIQTQVREERLQKLRALIGRLKQNLTAFGCRLDDHGMIIESADAPSEYVVYDHDPILQNATQIHFSGGRLFTDGACRVPLDTQRSSNIFTGAGMAIYVMSATGRFHVTSQLKDYRHHSSILAGANVACAGEISVANGLLKLINNKSGHYKPNQLHLYQVLHQLKKNNVSGFRLEFIDNDQIKGEYSVDAFMSAIEQDYYERRLVCYVEGTSPETLIQLGWTFIGAPSEDRSIGMYDTVTGARIPYKQVVSTLKSHHSVAEPEINFKGLLRSVPYN